jgi:hypothetical protein
MASPFSLSLLYRAGHYAGISCDLQAKKKIIFEPFGFILGSIVFLIGRIAEFCQDDPSLNRRRAFAGSERWKVTRALVVGF